MQNKELEIEILSLLLDARFRRPKTGGASANVLNIYLNTEFKIEIEPSKLDKILEGLVSQNLISKGERLLMISSQGMDHLFNSEGKKYGTFAYFTRGILSVLCNESGPPKLVMDRLNIENDQIEMLELSFWYLYDKDLVEMGEREFRITSTGLQCLKNWKDKTSFEELSKFKGSER